MQNFGIDTIKVVSPEISPENALIFKDISNVYEKRQLIKKLGQFVESGSIFFNLPLEGSFSRYMNMTVNGCPETGRDFLILEGSLNKYFIGHNLFGASLSLESDLQVVIDSYSEIIGFELPKAGLWSISRVDISANQFMTDEEIFNTLDVLQKSHFPRLGNGRQGLRGTSVMFGTTANRLSLVVYAKGPEFQKNDYRHLKEIYSKTDSLKPLKQLVSIANQTLRFEWRFNREFWRSPIIQQRLKEINITEIELDQISIFNEKEATEKKRVTRRSFYDWRKENNIFGSQYHQRGALLVNDISPADLMGFYNYAWGYLMDGVGKLTMKRENKRIRSLLEVEKLLTYEDSRGRSRFNSQVYGTYQAIISQGLINVRQRFEKMGRLRTFQRHIKVLRSLNVDLQNGELKVQESQVFEIPFAKIAFTEDKRKSENILQKLYNDSLKYSS